ncbi:peptidylprolyl isomerase [Ruegeria sp. 2012CJ41-6]|uniref:Parvulin-like PPIase n=1 Tax=Ruegeria spongiae TaxID=2942209 RepID=A0ABT0PZH2_9RHOB|nr:peptidylprolyl isomerase [Ruegeria spongiae]MCL6282975.1 peptidylprolyl isomerase [Ruegeria spongiae]
MQKILTRLTRPLALGTGLALSVILTQGAAQAQGLFSPAIRVNQEIITTFELEQRIKFMDILNLPGDPEKDAREALIDDRLRQQVISEAGMEVAPEDVQVAIDDFANRADMTGEEFVKALNDAGISQETLRDFVRNQLAWRDYVQARYLSQARPTQQEIDRALGQAGGSGGLRVLMSEVIIPITPQTLAQAEALAAEISRVEGYDAFSAAAAQYSASDTRTNGGRLDWLPITQIPPALQPAILALAPGEITSPIPLPNAIALFQMRGIQEVAAGTPRYATIDYATYFIPGGRTPEALSKAAEIAERIDTCDDLYGIAKGQPETVLDRKNAKPSEIPKDIALELAKLDPDEVSTTLTRNNGQTLVLLMLCSRTRDLGDDASREDVARALTEQRLNAFAASLLAQLRADAVIVEQ